MSAAQKFMKFMNISVEDDFIDLVFVEIEEFLNLNTPVGVLVFPPLSSRERLVIHKIGQEFFNVDTFSVGQHRKRRTVVCQKGLKKKLTEDNVEMEDKDNKRGARGAVAKTKRTNRPDAPIYVPPASRKKNVEPPSRVNTHKDIPKGPKVNKNSFDNVGESIKNEKELERPVCSVPDHVIVVPSTQLEESDLNRNNTSDNKTSDIEIDTSSSKENQNKEKTSERTKFWSDQNNDQDEKELNRAREEINRKKKIMKHSFINSDILIIDEKLSNVKVSETFKPKNESTDAVDNWEDLLDDKTLDSALMVEIIENVGNVEVYNTKNNFNEFKQPPLVYSDYSHVLEVYDFPNAFRTRDLVTIIDSFKCKPFHIKWVDDSHALVVFASGFAATEVLNTHSHPLVKFRPLSQATEQSIFKATKNPEALLPNAIRPQTCPQTARRMVTGALGLRMSNAKEERAQEIKILKEAREKKRLSAKQQDDAWEGHPFHTTDD